MRTSNARNTLSNNKRGRVTNRGTVVFKDSAMYFGYVIILSPTCIWVAG